MLIFVLMVLSKEQRAALEMQFRDLWVKPIPDSLCFTAENPDDDMRHCPGSEKGL